MNWLKDHTFPKVWSENWIWESMSCKDKFKDWKTSFVCLKICKDVILNKDKLTNHPKDYQWTKQAMTYQTKRIKNWYLL